MMENSKNSDVQKCKGYSIIPGLDSIAEEWYQISDFCCPGALMNNAIYRATAHKVKRLISFLPKIWTSFKSGKPCFHTKEYCFQKAFETEFETMKKIEAFLSMFDLNRPISDGKYALDYAREFGNVDSIRLVLKHQKNTRTLRSAFLKPRLEINQDGSITILIDQTDWVFGDQNKTYEEKTPSKKRKMK